MTELTARQMAEALRRCGGTTECTGCPYTHLGTAKCIQIMQKDAAAMIEGQVVLLRKQEGTLDKLRAMILNK